MRDSIWGHLGPAQVPLIEGEAHGSAEWCYPNGSVRAIGEFRRGRLDGLFLEFDPEGNLLREVVVEAGIAVVEARWLPDGTTDGLWFERGGTSLMVEWFRTGDARSVCEVKNGLPDGFYVELHTCGTLSASGSFSSGERSGDWCWFDESGKPIGAKRFEVGASRRTAERNEQHRPDWLW